MDKDTSVRAEFPDGFNEQVRRGGIDVKIEFTVIVDGVYLLGKPSRGRLEFGASFIIELLNCVPAILSERGCVAQFAEEPTYLIFQPVQDTDDVVVRRHHLIGASELAKSIPDRPDSPLDLDEPFAGAVASREEISSEIINAGEKVHDQWKSAVPEIYPDSLSNQFYPSFEKARQAYQEMY
jgi:hypothetical protein